MFCEIVNDGFGGRGGVFFEIFRFVGEERTVGRVFSYRKVSIRVFGFFR